MHLRQKITVIMCTDNLILHVYCVSRLWMDSLEPVQ